MSHLSFKPVALDFDLEARGYVEFRMGGVPGEQFCVLCTGGRQIFCE